jgi:hypothetical protein
MIRRGYSHFLTALRVFRGEDHQNQNRCRWRSRKSRKSGIATVRVNRLGLGAVEVAAMYVSSRNAVMDTAVAMYAGAVSATAVAVTAAGQVKLNQHKKTIELTDIQDPHILQGINSKKIILFQRLQAQVAVPMPYPTSWLVSIEGRQ